MMSSFFRFLSPKRTIRAAMQTFNLYILANTIYELLTNPDPALGELHFKFLAHFISVFALKADSSTVTQSLSILINSGRMGGIFQAVTSGVSAFSLNENLSSALLNCLNLVMPSALAEAEEERSTSSLCSQRTSF